jgi:hypothetical protein
MERLFFECTVRAALLVAGTAMVLYAMRVKAAAKHGVSDVVVQLLLPRCWGRCNSRINTVRASIRSLHIELRLIFLHNLPLSALYP